MKRVCHFAFFISIIFLIMSCNGRGPRGGSEDLEPIVNTNTSSDKTITGTPVKVIPVQDSKYRINVYLENTGSMNGFINQNSEFQDAFQRLTALLKHHYNEGNLFMNYINTKIHPRPVPTNVDLLDFAEELVKPHQFRSAGNVGSTDLNNIVEMILDEIENNEISILISDCIYSISGTGTTASMLATCKNKTFDHFLEKSKTFPDLSTLIIAMNSSFSGNYWDYRHPSGKASQLLNCDRPYYICVLGSASAVNSFNEIIAVEELNGYTDKLLLTTVDKITLDYNTLSTSYKLGQFRMKAPNTLSEVRKDRNNNFEFAIAVNMSNMPMTDIEKTNVSNYETSSQNYIVSRIVQLEENQLGLNPKDKDLIQKINATHLVCVACQGPLSPINLQVKIKNTLPVWVKSKSSMDDTGIGANQDEQNKTFGLEYFVKGMFDAYRENTPEKDYLKALQVEIKQ